MIHVAVDDHRSVLPDPERPDEIAPVLRHEHAGDHSVVPASGVEMLVLRDPKDVKRSLTDPSFVMANMDPPLTGAEMQDPDGGLLTMDPPHLLRYRRALHPVMNGRRVRTGTPAAIKVARDLLDRVETGGEVDLRAEYADPFVARLTTATLCQPESEWPDILDKSQAAFGVVDDHHRSTMVRRSWSELYARNARRIDEATEPGSNEGLIASAAFALGAAGIGARPTTHAISTLINGFPSVGPVLVVTLRELLRRPTLTAEARTGRRSWISLIVELTTRTALFPFALPRRTSDTVELGHRRLPAGTVVLPSLVAAGRRGATRGIAFGAGPHFCPGALYSLQWLAVAVSQFFSRFPSARLSVDMTEWERATLPTPRRLLVTLT